MDIKELKRHYDIVGNDPNYLMALNKAVQVSATDLSILITGESGVGKDVFSRIIHDNSLRRTGKLISVNCGAIPSGTIESELFGHLAGSFTGAEKSRKGYFEEADGGTIFLDEIGELPAHVQVKLLRVLQNGEIMPVGSSTPRKVDVRIVAATNVNLLQALRAGRFREDLYYRLNQITITIPPLRERRDDIPLLFRKFATDMAEVYHMQPLSLTDDATEYLVHYPWQGNVRELKNITDQVSVLESSRVITREILQKYLVYVPEERLPATLDASHNTEAPITDRELLLKALNVGQMINDMRTEMNNLRQVVTQLAQSIPMPQSMVDNKSKQMGYNNLAGFDDVKMLPSSNATAINNDTTIYDSPSMVNDEPMAAANRDKINSMRSEINNLRQVVSQLAQGVPMTQPIADTLSQQIQYNDRGRYDVTTGQTQTIEDAEAVFDSSEVIDDEPLALEEREKKAIQMALQRHGGKRKFAAKELGISERTLYRKLKIYGL